MKNKMTPAEALCYGKHFNGCVSINKPPYEGQHRHGPGMHPVEWLLEADR